VSRRLILLGLLAVLACRIEQRLPRAGPGAGPVSPDGVLRVPPDSEIPAGPLGASIRRGRALLRHTPDSLPRYARSALRCFSCHLKEGTQAGALPLVGVYSRFPQYRSRNALINLIEDRINDCFARSLNGTPLPRDGPDMRDLVAYFGFISRGIAPPGEVPGLGVPPLPDLRPDTGRGRQLFATVCARCHGPDGQGTGLAPPLWGPRSFNIGAGMARLRTAAGFIRENMPNDRAVVLTDQQAYDVAAFVLARPRPDFAAKADDWPNGDPPPDVAYPTRAGRRK
jgi:thiosulfate dehydrogenase